MKLKGAIKKMHFMAPKLDLPTHSPTSTLVFDNNSVGDTYRQALIPGDMPKGFFAVHVGEECRRYVIPVHYLKHPTFKVLLGLAEEEFGFDYGGAIQLPCDVVSFDHLLWLLSRVDT